MRVQASLGVRRSWRSRLAWSFEGLADRFDPLPHAAKRVAEAAAFVLAAGTGLQHVQPGSARRWPCLRSCGGAEQACFLFAFVNSGLVLDDGSSRVPVRWPVTPRASARLQLFDEPQLAHARAAEVRDAV